MPHVWREVKPSASRKRRLGRGERPRGAMGLPGKPAACVPLPRVWVMRGKGTVPVGCQGSALGAIAGALRCKPARRRHFASTTCDRSSPSRVAMRCNAPLRCVAPLNPMEARTGVCTVRWERKEGVHGVGCLRHAERGRRFLSCLTETAFGCILEASMRRVPGVPSKRPAVSAAQTGTRTGRC
jgi:hypothetical protein